MKVEAICSNHDGECPTVIDVSGIGHAQEFFRHVQLVEVDKINPSARTAIENDELARCSYCLSPLIVLRPTMLDARLALGRISVSVGVRALLNADEDPESYARQINEWLNQHRRGEWGMLEAPDKKVQESALNIENGQAQGRCLSVWSFGGQKVWIWTERGRHETTILLPEEY